MGYLVKELFHTLQGEGGMSGRAAVFCRFTGCNLWSGQERHRHTAICTFCDTDFVGTEGPGGGNYRTAGDLADAVARTWSDAGAQGGEPYVVCTGGEPLLQLDVPAVDALHAHGFTVGVETNGTQPAPDGVDWICVSPKARAELVLTSGNELKLVFPQHGAPPASFEHLAFDLFFLQPMDGPDLDANTRAAIDYCRRHPRWRLSLQTHKFIGIP